MPNWCCTRIRVNCDCEDTAEKLEKAIREAMEMELDGVSADYAWLGKLLIHQGICKTVDEAADSGYSLRGGITYLDRDACNVYIDTDTAWVPMLGVFLVFLERLFRDLNVTPYQFFFTCEEPGCCLFYTNEPELEGKANVSYFVAEGKLEETLCEIEEADKETVEEKLRAFLEKDEGDAEELVKELNEKYPDLCLAINFYEHAEPSEL